MKLPAPMQIDAGSPHSLGATVTPAGVNFAVFSSTATRIEVCLYDRDGKEEIGRFALPVRTNDVWHGLLRDVGAGLVYGLRAWGPADAAGLDNPQSGQRFAPAKLLLDPYARALVGQYRPGDLHLTGDHLATDSASAMVKAVVVDDDDFDWGDDTPPGTSWSDTILYEVHVKGFSQRHPDIDLGQRGTFAGLASDAAIAHFQSLGITTLSLLPVHQAVDEIPLSQRGLVNYWGYNTLAFFAPNSRYATLDARREFREMVRRLHAAGFEVIIDVVYNHTAEGDHTGPTLSWRGLDNAAYYRLRHDDRRFYENYSGCGNTLNLSHPRVLQMVMDSLRYWVTQMHVDGFRFDLAAILGRTGEGFDMRATFFQAVAQDPVLKRVKLIAEPWDLGPGGYRLGGFPGGWSEWNDRYRRALRAFWLSKTADRGEFAARLAGSRDVFGRSHRGPHASINYVCSHDGFTLCDLLSYNGKHNLANGEDNRDGSNENLSWNCGEEGPSSLRTVNAMRERLARALLATLLLSRGVPMLLGGDELGRTQQGNNNAFGQDNPVSWFDWARTDSSLSAFVAGMIRLRKRYAPLRHAGWFAESSPGSPVDGAHEVDPHLREEPIVHWLDRHGLRLTSRPGNEAERFVLGLEIIGPPDVLMLFNGEARECAFPLPAGDWRIVLDTASGSPFDSHDSSRTDAGSVLLAQRSVVVLERGGDA